MRKTILLSGTMSIAGVVLALPAFAQAASSNQPVPPSSATESAGPGVAVPATAPPQSAAVAKAQEPAGLADIVVTAQRREERLQRVPITVTVLGGELAAKTGAASVADLGVAVPNLEMSVEQNGITPFIRGVGSALVAQGNEPSVATYVDGVYFPSAVGAWFDFNNIERIEVLAGPQGTLFGRNATGGVIQVVTKDPTQKTSGQISAGYGNFSTVTSNGYLTGGVTNNLAADLAFSYRHQGDGWGQNLNGLGGAYKRNELALRSKWLWNIGSFEVRATGDYDRVRSDEGLASRLLPGSVGDDGVTTYHSFYDPSTSPNNHYLIHQGGATLNIAHEFAWGGKVVSISSFRKITGDTIYDEDVTPAQILGTNIHQTETTYTQELQLLSSRSSGVQWTTGLYFFHDSAAYNPLRIMGTGLGGLPYLDIDAKTGTVSYAAYGQATIPLGEKFSAILGGRYTTDKRTVVGSENFGGSFIGYVDPNSGSLAPGEFAASKRFSKFTYKGGLNYQFTPSVLGFVSASRGFKSGIFNSIQFTTPAVKPEVLDSYEAGIKSSLLNNRLIFNISGFHYNYSDIQLYEAVSGAVVTYNATSAKINGVDVQATAAPFEGFTVTGGISYLDGHYGTFLNAPIATPNPAGGNTVTSGNVTGNTTIYSPHWKGSLTASYRIPVGLGRIELSGTYSYTGNFYWAPDNKVQERVVNILNANAALVSRDELWRLSVWGKNLAGIRYYSYVTESTDGNVGAPAEPRTFGFTATRKF